MAIELILEWEGVGAPSYARRFRTAAAIDNFYPALQEIATLAIAPAIQRNFDEGGRPKWAPLSAETIRAKIGAGYFSPHRVLVATGAMMESAVNPGNYIVTEDTIVAEPGPFYWIYHQQGTQKMPQRVIMNLQLGDQRKIGGIFDRFIAQQLAKTGLKVYGQTTTVVGGGVGI